MDENPYESPRALPENFAERMPHPPHWLIVVLFPTAWGLLLGGTLMADSVRGPGDLTGQSIGACIGGLGGLLVGILVRAVSWLRIDR